MPTVSSTIKNLADLQDRLGGVPLNRIRFRPCAGSATVQDLIDLHERQDVLCELVEGVLVEKAVGFTESALTGFLGGLVNAFVRSLNLGIVTGPDGAMELSPGLVRIPDVAFTSWDRLPGRRCPTASVPSLAPNLAIEILSRSNTRGEMIAKRQDYFAAGVEVVWEIDPDVRGVVVYTGVNHFVTLTASETLEGGSVLPGFTLVLQELFAELDRHG